MRVRWAGKRLGCGVLGVALLAAPDVHANGRFPSASQVVTKFGDPSKLALRTTFGLLLSNDGSGTWSWVCERGVGYSGMEDPPLAYTAGGTLVAGLSTGLRETRDGGCTWGAVEAIGHRRVVDVAVRDDAGHGLVAVTARDGQPAAVWSSDDDGASWSALADLPADVDPVTIDAAPGDPQRLYASGRRGDAGALLVSKDGGRSWTEQAVALQPRELAPFIAAVDPHDAARVYVRTGGGDESRLLVTQDSGATFRAVFAGAPLLGFALSPAGDDVWIGGRDGVLHAQARTLAFESVSPAIVLGLAHVDGDLLACGADLSGYLLGRSKDAGRTFAPLVRLSTIRGELECAASTRGQCPGEWDALRALFGVKSVARAASVAAANTTQGEGARTRTTTNAFSLGVGLACLALAMVTAIVTRRRWRRPRSP